MEMTIPLVQIFLPWAPACLHDFHVSAKVSVAKSIVKAVQKVSEFKHENVHVLVAKVVNK